jgi:hypothetical protein
VEITASKTAHAAFQPLQASGRPSILRVCRLRVLSCPRTCRSGPTNPTEEKWLKTLQDLFIHSLSDIYSAEKQMTKSLPKMARGATNPALKTAFETHLHETQGQIERIDQVVEACGIKLKRIKCVAMEGLVEE